MSSLQLTIALCCVGTALVISAITTPIVRGWSRRHDFVDRPGGHKAHAAPVALLGGISFVAAIVLPMMCALVAARFLLRFNATWVPAEVAAHLPGIVAKTSEGLAIIGGAIVLHFVGIWDDRQPWGAWPKFLVQLAVASFVVIGFDVRLLTAAGPVISTAASILWIITLTNAFNFLDNMDGLAAGVALIVACVFAVTAMQAGQLFVPACCWLVVGATLGFLPYNIHPASIFMGDAGSLVLGYLIAVLTILTTFYDASFGRHPAGVLAPLVVMAVPLYDTLSVFYLRWHAGISIWQGDRRHFSHRLQRRGLSVREAVGVIWLATAVTALPATLLPTASRALVVGIVLQTLAVVVLVAYLEKAGHDAQGAAS